MSTQEPMPPEQRDRDRRLKWFREARFGMLLGGAPVEFTQVRDRLVLHGLPARAPNPLATMIEMKFEGEPRQVLGAGHVLIDENPWG